MKHLEQKIGKHLKDRGWDKLRPVDLAKSIMIEGAELLEHFQWENASLDDVKKNKEKMEEIKKELADVLIFCIEMSVTLGFDTKKIILQKLKAAQKKYPAKLMKKINGAEPGASVEYWKIKAEYRKKK